MALRTIAPKAISLNLQICIGTIFVLRLLCPIHLENQMLLPHPQNTYKLVDM